MSSLQRYKKTGGFIQLLSLIETFGPQKKEKFLEMIDVESVSWGKALRDKMITLERMFQWPDQTVIEIFKNLPFKNLTYALEGLKPDQKARMLAFFSASERRRMEETLAEGLPKPEDMASNMVKLVESARKMLVHGDLRAEKFDETMLIPEDIESRLEVQGAHAHMEKVAAEEKHAPAVGVHASEGDHHSPAGAPSVDVGSLQRTLALVLKENRTMKDELRVLREKLDQIRKIA